MANKLYKKIKEIIYEYRYFLCSFLILLILFSIEFPYYIKKDGGTIDTKDRIVIENSYTTSGHFKMAYVSELKATLPSLLIAKIKGWDIVKVEDELGTNETVEENEFRNKILLNEANNSAILAAYKSAEMDLKINDIDVFVTYVEDQSKTNLKIGDKIISVNNQEITDIEELKKIISELEIGSKVKIKTDKEEKYAEVFLYENKKIIGIMISTYYDIATNVSFKFKSSESGPSGGLMMALSIYNYITPYDISKGRNIVGTGTISKDGVVGEISGVEYKLKGAIKDKADLFFVPKENYEEAIKVKKKNNYSIDIISVSTLDEAINYLIKSS